MIVKLVKNGRFSLYPQHFVLTLINSKKKMFVFWEKAKHYE